MNCPLLWSIYVRSLSRILRFLAEKNYDFTKILDENKTKTFFPTEHKISLFEEKKNFVVAELCDFIPGKCKGCWNGPTKLAANHLPGLWARMGDQIRMV